MCGIAGILNFKSQVLKQDLIKMTDAIKHRGPDGEGHWVHPEGHLGFGHRRLSIIDLSSAGDQPMHYAEGRYTITFNGEIYNYLEIKDQLITKGYKFTTNTDTEVILASYDYWGKPCIQKFDGMFAFAIWDNKEKELFCARDRFGEKPFYFYRDHEKFVFASEMKALWALGVPKEINHKMMFNFLFYNHESNPNDLFETFYTNCFSLPHSNYLKLDLNNKISYHKYFQIDPTQTNENITQEKAAEKLKELLYQSISTRLRSDVPVGTSLSGGLDSSIIATVVSDLFSTSNLKLKTFSAYFKGFEKDEKHLIDLLTKKHNLLSHSIDLANETYHNSIDQVVKSIEEPFNSLSILAQNKVMELAKNNNVPVLIDGQGADEILAGYHSYFNVFFKETFIKSKNEWKKQYRKYEELQKENSINQFRTSTLHKNYLKKYLPLLEKNSARKNYNKQPKNIPKEYLDYYDTYKKDKFKFKTHFKTLNEELHYHTFFGPLQQLLKYSDRNSMAHSIEVRLPYLNHELVEFIFSLPADFKINNGWTKWILRDTFNNALPNEICWKKEKIGYEPPKSSTIFDDKFSFANKYYNLNL